MYKLETIKDNTKTNSLLYHIVRKVLQENPKFQGFPQELMETLDQVATTSLASLDEKIALMESGCRFQFSDESYFYVTSFLFCRDPLGFLIEQDRIEAKEQHGKNYYHALHEFMNQQIINVHTIKKVKNVIMIPFNELLEWLAITPDGLKTQDFAKLLIDFFESVNKTRNEIKEAETKTKKSQNPGRPRKMSSANSTPNLLNMSDLKSEMTAKLANRSSQY